MAFIWTTPKSKGDLILKDVLANIRINTDYLDDNPASCLTHNGPILTGEWGTVEQIDYIINLSSDRLSYNGSYYSPRCTGQTGPGP